MMFIITQGILGSLVVTQGYGIEIAPPAAPEAQGTGYARRRRKQEDEERDMVAVVAILEMMELLD